MQNHRVCAHCKGVQYLQREVAPRHGQAWVWHCLNCAEREYMAVRFESAKSWSLLGKVAK